MTDRTDTLPRPDAVVFGADGSKSYGYTADTVRRLLAERDAEIERLRNLLDDEIKAWHAALSGQMTEAQRLRTERVEQDERIARLELALAECVESQEWYRRELDRLDAESGEDGSPNEQDDAEINARKLLETRNGR